MRGDLLDKIEAEVRPEPAQEPEYAAADAMAETEPEPVAEPDTVSREYAAATEPDNPIAEPEYIADDAMARKLIQQRNRTPSRNRSTPPPMLWRNLNPTPSRRLTPFPRTLN